MNNYKFRGKRKGNGEWVYGLLVMGVFNDTMIQINENGFCHTIVVCPETVGMFTGLKDKNGIEIYEGDIVLTKRFWLHLPTGRKKWNRFHGEVAYAMDENTGIAEWFVKVEDRDGYDIEYFGPFHDCEVKSNIHDHPHLLNPAQGAVTHTMNTDPNLKASEEAQTTEQATEGQTAALESEEQDQAVGADAEEGSVEG